MRLECCSKGESAEGGSFSKTSRAAHATFPELRFSKRASSSIIPADITVTALVS